MQKIVWDSRSLPDTLEDRNRFSLWRDVFLSGHAGLDLSPLADQPFQARYEGGQLGAFAIAQFTGTIEGIVRRARAFAEDGNDKLCIGLNRGRSLISCAQHNRELVLQQGTGVLLTNTEFGELHAKEETAWLVLCFPHALLRDRVANAEDLLVRPIEPNNAAARHLRRYLDMLLQPGGFENDPDLTAHIGTTLTDLIALTLGAGRDAAQTARMRGLRAARVQEVLAEIRACFADPAFSPHAVAGKTKLSERYLQDLLQETGASFTERVIELRLQKARAMLADSAHDRLKISEIAYACGFNEVSHFNRSFRTRFGASPTQFRGPGRNSTA
jgi:AraC-like DNA-binding protein